MANLLDELDGPIMENGRDVNVIAKQIPVTVGVGSKIFEVLLWVLGIIPGIVFLFKKINARKYFMQLEQKMQHDASQIDNYLDQRVNILQNCAKLLDKAIDLDKDTFKEIARYRSARGVEGDDARNQVATKLNTFSRNISVALENYPELKAHKEIENAMQQNSYLQKEITAARELYNDTVATWNREVFEWPTKQIVAAKQGYTTRIPFIASQETKAKANGVFF